MAWKRGAWTQTNQKAAASPPKPATLLLSSCEVVGQVIQNLETGKCLQVDGASAAPTSACQDLPSLAPKGLCLGGWPHTSEIAVFVCFWTVFRSSKSLEDWRVVSSFARKRCCKVVRSLHRRCMAEPRMRLVFCPSSFVYSEHPKGFENRQEKQASPTREPMNQALQGRSQQWRLESGELLNAQGKVLDVSWRRWGYEDLNAAIGRWFS